MNKLLSALALLILTASFTGNVQAQPVVKKNMSFDIIGDKGHLKSAPRKVTVTSYLVYFNMMKHAVQEKNDAYAGLRAYLTDADDTLIQEITDAGFQHLAARFLERGVEAVPMDADAIAGHKDFQKANSKKPEASVMPGGTVVWENEKAAIRFTIAIPHGVNHLNMGAGGYTAWKKVVDDVTRDKQTGRLNLIIMVDLADAVTGWKAGGGLGGSGAAAAKLTPHLRLYNELNYGFTTADYLLNKKLAMVTLNWPEIEYQGTDWISEIKVEDQGTSVRLSGAESKFANHRYHVNREKYKQAVVGMLNAYSDEIVTNYMKAFYGE